MDFLLQIEDDAYQEDLGFSLGQLGKSGSGRVRQAQVNDATKARISKSLQVKSPPFSSRPQLSSAFRRRDPGLSFDSPANAAEAEHDVRRQVHGQRPLLGNQLQRRFHSSPGKRGFGFVFNLLRIVGNNHVYL